MSAKMIAEEKGNNLTHSPTTNFTFDAFITYRRSDGSKAARRLRQKLQRYNITKRLSHLKARKLTVFLDTIYERGAEDFYERNIRPALLASKRLVVLATPDAVLKPDHDDWVHREINDFRKTNGAENILVVRVAGDFLAQLPGDLNITAPNIEVIDLRHDGFWSALSPLRASRLADEWIKLIAPLFDVSLDDMPKLRREQERAQQRVFAMVVGGLVGAIGFATTFSWYALSQQRASKQTLENSLFAVSRVVNTANSLQLKDAYTNDKRSMLMTACDLLDNLADKNAREKYVVEINKCNVDRISSLLDMREFDRAKTFLSTIEPKVYDQYKKKNDETMAGAICSLLDLRLRIFTSSITEDSEKVGLVRDNTQHYSKIFEQHLTLSLAESYLKRIWWLADALEKTKDYQGIPLVIEPGAKLLEAMAKKQKDDENESDDVADYRQNYGFRHSASLYRYLAWLKSETLEDGDGALDAVAKVLDLVQMGLGKTKSGSEQYVDLLFEEILALEIKGTEFIDSGRLTEGRAIDQYGLEIATKLLAFNLSEELRNDLQEESDYLKERIKRVTEVLALEENP